ncbi:MAG TPA: P-type DNA transfer ATPase VirB11 [Sphingopyxis sp.]|nr:P-type DNA transfer ATPase VirB11 [Sphingopyxis sp.]HMP45222.1 P-type DNA transfer ATPase VirB11 [Sphingopyxis sp.]HMQ18767.1 P-type DNA transfer ATPase VirB11 [Sphingopyxis sp.]
MGNVAVLPDDRVYFRSYLAPLAPLLDRADVTDIYVNRPGEAWAESLTGRIETHAIPALTEQLLERLARQIAALSHQGINREHPLLSATMPDGARVQVVAPPATRGGVVLAIRKHVAPDLRLEDYAEGGAFAATRAGRIGETSEADLQLHALLGAGDIPALLRAAVLGRRNVLISGGTSSGKTTFLNALLREVPADERLILIEDTPEITIHHPNAIGLLAARSALGETHTSAEDLLSASLRLRPDRIILGELRGPEAFSFLRAVNSGHPGSMTTIHADSPERAIEQLTLLVLQAGSRLDRADVHHYVRSTVDVFVQLDRSGGKRRIAEVKLREV